MKKKWHNSPQTSSLNSYIGGYKSTTHVHAIEDKKRFDGISQNTPKKKEVK